MAETVLRVQGLSKSFGRLSVLKNIDLTVERGERIALIGPSGTGKSVFLRSIAMLETPNTGNVFVGDTDITKRGVNLNLIRQKMGMVYQGFHLFSHMTVLDNITFAPIRVRKIKRKQAEEKAVELLSMVGLADKIYAKPETLSGGQKQRVAIARCLAMEPDILLFDEPTSALDPAMTAEVLAIIRKLTQTGLTLMLVTHEMGFAAEFASRVLYMDEGGIYEQGTPEQIFETPAKPKTIAFINRLKIFEEHIESTGFDFVGMNARVEIYFQKYGLERKRILNLQLLLEELLVLLFREQYAQTQPNIGLSVEYTSVKNEVKINISYSGSAYDPFEGDGQDMGVMLIRGLRAEKEHSYTEGKNTLTILLKN
jgi:polar amino acid transport system ATP-binding protein